MPRIISRIIDQYDFSGPPISGQYLKYDSASGVFRTAPISVTGVVSNITSNNGSVAVVTSGTNVDLSVTVASATNNVIVQVKNMTGSLLTKGTVVYINGATGQLSTVTKALANSDMSSAQTLGMLSADLANGGAGYVTIIGLIEDIDTSLYQDGDQLYLSGTTAGTFTNVKPYAPTHLVYVGVVEYAHQNHGKIFVKVQNGYELDEIHDISARYPSSGQTIVYNSASGLWQNSLLSLTAGVTGVLPVANGGTNASSLGTSGNVLYFDGSSVQGQNILLYSPTGIGINNSAPSGALHVKTSSSTDKALIVQGFNSQSGNLQEWQSSSGVSLAYIDASGKLYNNNILALPVASGSGNSITLAAGSGVTSGAGGNLILQAGVQATTGGDGKVIVRQASGQTSNLQEWQTPSGTLKSAIKNGGGFLFPTTSSMIYNVSQLNGYGTYGGIIFEDIAGDGRTKMRHSATSSSSIDFWHGNVGIQLVGCAGSSMFLGGTTRIGTGGNAGGSQSTNVLADQATPQGRVYFYGQTYSSSTNHPIWTNSYNGYEFYTAVNASWAGGQTGSVYGNKTLSASGHTWKFSAASGLVNPLCVQSSSGQTANLQEWQNSSSGILASIGPSGAISLLPYGTSLGNTNEIRFNELAANGSHYVGFKAANTIPSSVVWTLPSGEGASGQALITNGSGLLSWANSSTGTVTSVSGTGSVNGLTLTGTVTSSGAITLGGTLSNVSLISAVTDTLPIANGGTNATSLGSSGNLLYFDGTRIQAQTLLNYTASGIRAISPSTSGKPLIIQGVTGQTANLQEWQNVSGTALSYLDASGNFYAISKSFLIDHPSSPDKKLRYASLEGPEHAVFYRGTLINKDNITLPYYWKDLVHNDSITVSLTPKKYAQPNLFVEEANNIKIVVSSDRQIYCDYIIYGTRKDVDMLEVETNVG